MNMAEQLSYQKYDPSWGAGPIPQIKSGSTVDMLIKSVDQYSEKPVIIFLDRVITYGELDRLSDALAIRLASMGVEKGDRVATMLPNCAQHVIAFYAVQKLGAVIVPYNLMLKAEEAAYILKDSGAKLLIVLDLIYPLVQPEVQKLGITHVISVHVKDFSEPTATVPALLAGDKAAVEGTTDFMDAIAGETAGFSVVAVDPQDLSMILYTSGTTGFPKGAMVTHANFFDATSMLCAVVGLQSDDIYFMLFPQFHIAGYILNLTPAVYMGATIVPIPMFDPAEAMKTIEHHKITCFFSPPTGYIGLLSHPDFDKYDLTGIRKTVACGAPVPPAIQEQWQEKVGTYLYNGYGATETTGVAPGILELENRKRMGGNTLGSAMGELKIVDKNGEIVPRGTTGEMMLKGVGVVQGYWNKPEKTKEEFTDDGWWRSGDAAYMDEEGFIFFVERIKDLIIASGYNIAPVEVENHIYKHPAVQEVSVVGIPDGYRGETVKAFVVLKPDFVAKTSEEELIQFCRDNMAVYKAPKQVEFMAELPKTATGKILRRILREKDAPPESS
jgi:long-chain acyl-CoA synthetase